MEQPIDQQDIDWEAVYWEHMPRIYNFFRYRVGDDALAEDLTATTFEKAWKARAGYRNQRSAIATWLFTIARNTVTDYYRRRRPVSSLEDVLLVGNDPIGGDRPVEDHVLRDTELARLNALLADLTARERELVALKYGAELTNRAIAELTGLTDSNVGTILHRAVLRLRAGWEEVQP